MILQWQSELELFVRALLLGIVLRALYDLCLIRRALFRTKGKRPLTAAAEDLMYWLFCGVVVFALMFRHNSGVPRAFLYLAVAAGMVLYHFGPSGYVVAGVSRALRRIGRFLHSRIIKPLMRFGKRLQNRLKSITIKRNQNRKEQTAGEKKKKKKTSRRG